MYKTPKAEDRRSTKRWQFFSIENRPFFSCNALSSIQKNYLGLTTMFKQGAWTMYARSQAFIKDSFKMRLILGFYHLGKTPILTS